MTGGPRSSASAVLRRRGKVGWQRLGPEGQLGRVWCWAAALGGLAWLRQAAVAGLGRGRELLLLLLG
jgi:hypothetical protein